MCAVIHDISFDTMAKNKTMKWMYFNIKSFIPFQEQQQQQQLVEPTSNKNDIIVI